MSRILPLVIIAAVLAILTGCDNATKTDDPVDPTGARVYVVDKMNDRLLVFDYEGNRLGEDTRVTRPTDIDLYPGLNTVWVADFFNNRLSLYDLDLGYILSTEQNRLDDPISVAALPDGGCWTADRLNFDFVRVDNNGRELSRLHAFTPTRQVAYDPARERIWLATDSGSLYAVPADHTGDGPVEDAALLVLGELGTVRGLAVDTPNARVWVSDAYGGRLICLSAMDGTLLGIIEELSWPMGLAIHPDGDCWVAQWGGDSVLRVSGENLSIVTEYTGIIRPEDVAIGFGDDCWVVESAGNTLKLLSGGEVVVTVGGLSSPCGVELHLP